MSVMRNLAQYNPETVDTSEIEAICSKIPKSGEISLEIAEQLATRFLHGADRVTDLIAVASAHAGRCEAFRREAKSRAIDNKINGIGCTKVAASVAAQLFGDDPTYLQAHHNQAMSEAMLEWLRAKHRNLMAAHVLCKDIVKVHDVGRKQGNWTNANPHDREDLDGEDEAGKAATPEVGATTW